MDGTHTQHSVPKTVGRHREAGEYLLTEAMKAEWCLRKNGV